MNNFLEKVGVSKEWQLVDVLGFDPELLDMVPKPVSALLLLYPVDGVKNADDGGDPASISQVFYMKQTIANACATIALIHAIGNSSEVTFKDGSYIKRFLDESKSLSPEQIGKKLEESEEACEAHQSSAQKGQTTAPDISADVNFHFIALVERGGQLYELDGRKLGPISHGATTKESFLNDAAEVCKKFMNKNPECINFNVIALVKN